MRYKLFDPPKLTGKYLHHVLATGWLTSGPENQRLKEALSEKFEWPAERIVLAASATAAFQAILDLVAPDGDSCYVTPSTWPGMHQAIAHAGLELWPTRTVGGTCAVVVRTDIGGRRSIDGFMPVGNWVVRDACHSWWIDNEADFTLASFYPTKLVPGAEGGVVFCAAEEYATLLTERLYCGLRPGGAANGQAPTCCGRKANMTDVTAALNREALEHFETYGAQIKESWEHLMSRMDCNYILQPLRPYLFQIAPAAVQKVRRLLAEAGIPTAWNFKPAARVTLPCGPHIGPVEAKDIADAVARVYNEV